MSLESLWFEQDPVRALHERKVSLLDEGRSVIDLSMINPDLEPPRVLIDKLLEATLKSGCHRYAVSRGIRKLRESFVEKYRSKFGVNLDPETAACVVMGTKDAIVHTLAACCVPGETILVGTPTYPIFRSAAHLAGLKLCFFDIDRNPEAMLENIRLAIEQNPVRFIILNFPNNPTGITVPRSFFESLAGITAHRKIGVLNDFVYGEMSFEEPAVSMLSVPELARTGVETYSLSKAYSVPGWRVGAALGSPDIVEKLARLKRHLDYGLFLPLQHAAAAALNPTLTVAHQMTEKYRRRCQILSDGLRRIGWNAATPHAGVSVWAELPGHSTTDARDTCADLLEQGGILATPGTLYGAPFSRHIRFAAIQNEEVLTEAIERIETVVRQ